MYMLCFGFEFWYLCFFLVNTWCIDLSLSLIDKSHVFVSCGFHLLLALYQFMLCLCFCSSLIKKQQLQSCLDLPSIQRRRVMLEISSNGWIMNWSILSPSFGTVCKKIHILFAYQPTSLYNHISRIHHTHFSHYP